MNVSFNHLGGYEISFLSLLSFLPDEVRKEERLQNGEHDEEFYQDDNPQRLAYGHVLETIIVQIKRPVNKAVLIHSKTIFRP